MRNDAAATVGRVDMRIWFGFRRLPFSQEVLKTTEFNQNRPLILTKRNITDFNQNMAECSRNTIISLSLAI